MSNNELDIATTLGDWNDIYRMLVEILPDPIVVLDAEGIFYFSNPSARNLLKREHLVGVTIEDVAPPYIVRGLKRRLAAIKELNTDQQFEDIFDLPSGHAWLLTRFIPLPPRADCPWLVMVIARDMAAHKQTAEQLLLSTEEEVRLLATTLERRVVERTAQLARVNQRLREMTHLQKAILDGADYAIISTDTQGFIRTFNATAERWLGYTANEVVGQATPLIFHDPLQIVTRTGQLSAMRDDPILPNFSLFVALVEENGADEREWIYIRRDGTRLPVLLSLTTMRDEQNEIIGYLGIASDLSHRKEVEEDLRQSRDELRAALTALERAMRMKDEFLASMSHELRTPLNAILGRAEVLLDGVYGALSERQQYAVRSMQESGRHLLALINDILDLARIEAGQLTIHPAPVPIHDICNASIQMITQEARNRTIGLTLTLDPQIPLIHVDVLRFKQILINLLSNAVKFTPEHGEVGLEVRGDPLQQKATFTVWDTGIGIEANDLLRLFQPFIQLDSRLNRQYGGTGLGLALVARLVRLHGGGISVASTPGQGSRFTVTIPWVPTWASVPGLPTSPKSANAINGKGALILIAEDNDSNLMTIRDYLNAHNYQALVAHNGIEAIALVMEHLPALILMDIQMPKMNGIEAIRRIRVMDNAHVAGIPIIALTALAMPGDRERCLAAGADAYLTKPFGMQALTEMIETLLHPTDITS